MHCPWAHSNRLMQVYRRTWLCLMLRSLFQALPLKLAMSPIFLFLNMCALCSFSLSVCTFAFCRRRLARRLAETGQSEANTGGWACLRVFRTMRLHRRLSRRGLAEPCQVG